MGSQDKSNRGSTKGVKCKGSYNDNKGRSSQLVARQTITNKILTGCDT